MGGSPQDKPSSHFSRSRVSDGGVALMFKTRGTREVRCLTTSPATQRRSALAAAGSCRWVGVGGGGGGSSVRRRCDVLQYSGGSTGSFVRSGFLIVALLHFSFDFRGCYSTQMLKPLLTQMFKPRHRLDSRLLSVLAQTAESGPQGTTWPNAGS